ncbi:hypothetical protein COHA_002366 [Chlorella ohadii]|uniref:Fe2OG dioxygenase domain-containing protein n=1 Tax=Chlorella ohadii TaxID=2649997 RepID=A0AAD5H4W3_9CHLO|nr:hypothetical protein COHA_002366 [Chlorella ohadii]
MPFRPTDTASGCHEVRLLLAAQDDAVCPRIVSGPSACSQTLGSEWQHVRTEMVNVNSCDSPIHYCRRCGLPKNAVLMWFGRATICLGSCPSGWQTLTVGVKPEILPESTRATVIDPVITGPRDFFFSPAFGTSCFSGTGKVLCALGGRPESARCSYTWRGTAPDCRDACEPGETLVAKDWYGDGTRCLSGTYNKMLCERCQEEILNLQDCTTPTWFGTAPLCAGECNVGDRVMARAQSQSEVPSDQDPGGFGKTCSRLAGWKVRCHLCSVRGQLGSGLGGQRACTPPKTGHVWPGSPVASFAGIKSYAACCQECRDAPECRRFHVGAPGCFLFANTTGPARAASARPGPPAAERAQCRSGSSAPAVMAGPSSLMAMAEDEVLEGLFYNYKRLESPFCVGGSLGRIPVRLAVAAPEGGGAAQTLELPGGGQDAVEALLQACEPAVFGKGKETVRDDSYRSALALKGERLYSQDFEALHLTGLLAAVGRLLLPAAGPPARAPARAQLLQSGLCPCANGHPAGGFFKKHRDTPRGDPGFVGSLVVALPVAHNGGALRVEHGKAAVEYAWGPAAAEGEVQWAAFFPDCTHEVLPVTEGTRVALAYELFDRPDTASGPPEPLRALTGGAEFLLHQLHAYPHSMAQSVDQAAVRAMLKGTDAVVLHVLSALGVPSTVVRVWEHGEEELEMFDLENEEDYEKAESALFVSPIPSNKPLKMSKKAGERAPARSEVWRQRETAASLLVMCARVICFQAGRGVCAAHVSLPRFVVQGEWSTQVLKKDTGAQLDLSINWLGGRMAFADWTLGTIGQFWGNGARRRDSRCLGIVAEVPAFAARPTISEGSLAWAGQQSVITSGAPPAKPASKAKAKAGRGRAGKRGG